MPHLSAGKFRIAVATFLTALFLMLLSGCGDTETNPGLTRAEVEDVVASAAIPTPGLTRAEAEEIVGTAIAAIPAPEPGLTRAEAEEIVGMAIATIPTPEPELTREEIRQIAGSAVAYIPPKSDPADYTKFFVENAIGRYESDGLEATLAYYNRVESIDGQWYVFIIDADDKVIAHYDAHLLGEDINGPVGTDANGYTFGSEMLAATEDGKWVSYVYRNPENEGIGSGEFELKNVWVVRHDGLLFASGWHIGADEFTERLVSIAVDNFRKGGLPATLAFFRSPGDDLAGMDTAIDYYNDAETLEGRWFAFIEDPSGNIVAQSSSLTNGPDVQELLSGEPFDATEGGAWVTSESLRVYVVEYDGFIFAFGWGRDE